MMRADALCKPLHTGGSITSLSNLSGIAHCPAAVRTSTHCVCYQHQFSWCWFNRSSHCTAVGGNEQVATLDMDCKQE